MQDLDARADQLAHQRSHLPELVEIAELRTTRSRVIDELRDIHVVLDDLSAEQAKVDADVEQAKTRRVRDQDRLDRGLVSNPKDLERIQHEMVSLARRISSLEDDELEVMAQVEDTQRTLDGLQQQVNAAEDRLSALETARDDAVARIDEEVAALSRQRDVAAEGLPADLVTLYDRLRAQKGGVAASELRQRQCGGCRLGIDNAELSRIASLAPEEVVRCEECSRILVRTDQSGL